jgi:hypothetical protein
MQKSTYVNEKILNRREQKTPERENKYTREKYKNTARDLYACFKRVVNVKNLGYGNEARMLPARFTGDCVSANVPFVFRAGETSQKEAVSYNAGRGEKKEKKIYSRRSRFYLHAVNSVRVY